MEEKRYTLTYVMTNRPEEAVTRAQAHALGERACDAAVVCSLDYASDGSMSMAVESLDGRTGQELPPRELFVVWTTLARHLANRPDLTKHEREFCASLFWQILRDEPRRG